MAKKLNYVTISRLKYFSEISSILIMAFGFMIILGWTFDISILKSPGAEFSTVKSNLALCFVLIGISLLLLQKRIISRYNHEIAQILAFIVVLIGFLTIIQHISFLDFGIDQILFNESPGAIYTLSPNRMEFIAALNLLFTGIAIILLGKETKEYKLIQFLVIAVGILSLMAFIGHIYEVPKFSAIWSYAGVAIYAAVIFMMISAAVLFLCPDKSMMRVLTSAGLGSAFAWKLIPLIIIVPSLIGYFYLLGQKIGLYDNPFEDTTLILSMIIIFTIITWISLNSLNKIDYKRHKNEEDIRKLADIVNSSDEAIISKDLNSIISSWNKGAEKIYGYSSSEMIGKHISSLMTSSEWAKVSKLVEKVKKGKSVAQYEVKRLRKDGKGIYVSVTLSPIKNCEGKIAGISIIARDISKRKNAEKQLKETIDKLKHSNDELQQFAYITSHDLQEPLRTIASFTQLLEKRYKNRLDSDADEYIDFIVDAAVRMKEMIQGLLYYSRVGTKGGEFKLISAEEALKDALSNLQPIVEENKAKITYDNLPTVTADKGQLTHVFQNLIENAIKFKKPHIPPKIHISAQKDDKKNEYIFSVSDNGIGIEPQYSDKIFEVFKRLHTIDEYKGAGIGLAISKRILERHKGNIWVESELYNGSTFYFSIPST